jgi:hypothetical protein
MDCPLQSPYKTMCLKKHLAKGSLKGTILGWMKESGMFTSYYVAGMLGDRYIETSYVNAEFYDGVDRFVLTHSGSLYKLGNSATDAKKVKGKQGCLSVEEERKNVHFTFIRWMQVVEAEKCGVPKPTSIAD